MFLLWHQRQQLVRAHCSLYNQRALGLMQFIHCKTYYSLCIISSPLLSTVSVCVSSKRVSQAVMSVRIKRGVEKIGGRSAHKNPGETMARKSWTIKKITGTPRFFIYVIPPIPFSAPFSSSPPPPLLYTVYTSP